MQTEEGWGIRDGVEGYKKGKGGIIGKKNTQKGAALQSIRGNKFLEVYQRNFHV